MTLAPVEMNYLPAVSKLLQARYEEARRIWVSDPSNGLLPYPKRRTSKRKPIPATLDVREVEG
ncbi:hypothetical protein [Phenylobacterium sp.]|uniref:hypothetical protein n=1 Tax=Phenylobacterium sp. TaxID=1871053 RepID=UPI00271D9FB6|nr:hypothetical protein [Phenylobacterium sp.]MDO8800031.1 hypothetical protein [Phenylobacterium sp.]